jgi:carbon-monoxide dehydrogenase small subunit
MMKEMKMRKDEICLRVNGREHRLSIESHLTLLDVIRDVIGLTGTKRGCDLGQCGACTVLIDGKPYNACLILPMDVQGKEIVTIEGLAQDGQLHPIQQAFIEQGAIQCGFCTPGMVLGVKALLDADPSPSEEKIKEALSGNLCRCTGFVSIVRAVQSLGGKREEERED